LYRAGIQSAIATIRATLQGGGLALRLLSAAAR
jgi:hypothetical protein